jgi:NAD(P)-dependent dehydrogenase (short-subunit alcohol dehydrogenase family)
VGFACRLARVRAALVTGASTGIGRATALALDGRGWQVFAGVRREEDGESLRAAASDRLEPVILDVTVPEQIAAATEQVAASAENGLHGLVNNAGIAVPGPLETLPLAEFRRQLEVGLVSYVAMTQAFLPQIRGNSGRLVFLSSIGGRVPFPLNGAYHAAKYGTEAIGDVFRQELAQWGIRVAIIEPGSIDTPIWARGEATAEAILAATPETERLYGRAVDRFREVVRQTAERGIPPERVAKSIVHALESKHPRSRYLVGIDAKLQARIVPLLPTPLLDRLVGRHLSLR